MRTPVLEVLFSHLLPPRHGILLEFIS
jgi:hypothetical protein